MKIKIEDKIKYDSESHSLDFKLREYPLGNHHKKHELLKDISAFANHPSDNDKFIIVGVSEKDGLADEVFDIENLFDDADYQQYVISNIEPKINFEYKPITHDGKQIAYFRIFGNKSRPYLFNKEIKSGNKIKYEAGDGYIRAGTSTRKIIRDDLESIYKNRYTQKDRKINLEIEGYFGTPDANCDDIISWGLDYIDLKVTNKSNKSIDFDIEIKFLYNENYQIVSRGKFIQDLQEAKRKENQHFAYPSYSFIYESLNINFREYKDCVIISRNILAQKKSAITLKQNSTMNNIFLQELLVLNKEIDEISAEVTIRSDDFTEGALIKNIIYKR